MDRVTRINWGIASGLGGAGSMCSIAYSRLQGEIFFYIEEGGRGGWAHKCVFQLYFCELHDLDMQFFFQVQMHADQAFFRLLVANIST